MSEKKSIFKGKLKMQKIAGKGGWTYLFLDMFNESLAKQLNMQLVSAIIDNQQFDSLRLMPMGDGNLFLPLKKEIRKSLKKEAGDQVVIELFVPKLDRIGFQELKECLEQDEEPLWRYFMMLDEQEQELELNRINKITKPEAQAEEILALGKALKHRFKRNKP